MLLDMTDVIMNLIQILSFCNCVREGVRLTNFLGSGLRLLYIRNNQTVSNYYPHLQVKDTIEGLKMGKAANIKVPESVHSALL